MQRRSWQHRRRLLSPKQPGGRLGPCDVRRQDQRRDLAARPEPGGVSALLLQTVTPLGSRTAHYRNQPTRAGWCQRDGTASTHSTQTEDSALRICVSNLTDRRCARLDAVQGVGQDHVRRPAPPHPACAAKATTPSRLLRIPLSPLSCRHAGHKAGRGSAAGWRGWPRLPPAGDRPGVAFDVGDIRRASRFGRFGVQRTERTGVVAWRCGRRIAVHL